MTPDQPSPLTTASPSALQELFSQDPLKLTQQDRRVIVEELRRMRAIWQNDQALGRTTRAKKATVATGPAPSLEDLGL